MQIPGDAAAGTLTVRARVRSDLVALQGTVLPALGVITESHSTDYRFRATAPRPLVEAAVAKLVAQLDYSNFKSQVAKVVRCGKRDTKPDAVVQTVCNQPVA